MADRRPSLLLVSAALLLLVEAATGCQQQPPEVEHGAWFVRGDVAYLECEPGRRRSSWINLVQPDSDDVEFNKRT